MENTVYTRSNGTFVSLFLEHCSLCEWKFPPFVAFPMRPHPKRGANLVPMCTMFLNYGELLNGDLLLGEALRVCSYRCILKRWKVTDIVFFADISIALNVYP